MLTVRYAEKTKVHILIWAKFRPVHTKIHNCMVIFSLYNNVQTKYQNFKKYATLQITQGRST